MLSSPHKPFSPARWPFFYGYAIVFCSTIGILASGPGQTIGVSVFTDHLIKALAVSRLQLSLAYTLGTIGSSLIVARAGRFLDTAGVRRVAFYTACGLGAVLLYMSQVDRIAGFLTALAGGRGPTVTALVAVTGGFLLMRFFGQGVLTLCSKTMLMRWFMRLRGRMNSILGVTVTLTFSAAPLFFELLIRKFGWRGAWVFLGVLIGLGASVFVAIFFRDSPEQCGLRPDGDSLEEEAARANGLPREVNYTLREARRTPAFWIFNLSLSMFSLLATAFAFHVVSIFAEAGLPRTVAISVFLPSACIGVAVNILGGTLSDLRFFHHRLNYLLMVQLTGLLLLSAGILYLGTSWGRPVVILGNGMAAGLFGTLSSVSWPRLFGRKHLGSITGSNMSFLVFSSAVGPSLFGASYSVTGSYEFAVFLCIAALALMLAASFKATHPENR